VLLAQDRFVVPKELAKLIDLAVAVVDATTPTAATPPYR